MEEEEGGLCRSVPAVPNFRRRPKPTIPLHSKCIKDQLCFWHHAFSTNRSPTISSSIQSSTRRGELYIDNYDVFDYFDEWQMGFHIIWRSLWCWGGFSGRARAVARDDDELRSWKATSRKVFNCGVCRGTSSASSARSKVRTVNFLRMNAFKLAE